MLYGMHLTWDKKCYWKTRRVRDPKPLSRTNRLRPLIGLDTQRLMIQTTLRAQTASIPEDNENTQHPR
jgi:hypothetical protein